MNKLQKTAYCVGMGIAVSVFVLFLFSFLPHLIYNNQWDSMQYNQHNRSLDLSEEEIMEKFNIHPVYLAFYEKYPNAKEELTIKDQSAELELGMANFDTNSYLKVHFNLSSYNNFTVNVNAHCQMDEPHMEDRQNKRADGMFVEEFIKVTECVN